MSNKIKYMIDPRKNENIPLTCANCVINDIWTCKKHAQAEVENPYKERRSDCPIKEIKVMP